MTSFSIIIPFKTGIEYLKECLNSALSQDYTNFNIIILSDNTSNLDGSIDYVKTLNNKNIIIQESFETLNILENWGRIKSLDRKEFMTILGYDDVLAPDFLSTISKLIQTEPKASLYHTHFNYIDSKGTFIKNCLPLPYQLNAIDYLSLSLKEAISIMATGYVFRSCDYDSIGGIPTNYPNLIYADLFLWIELTKKSYLSVAPSTHFSFRIHNSTTKTSKDKILLLAFIVFLKYLHALAINDKFSNTIKSLAPNFIANTTKSLAHRILRTPKIYRDGISVSEIFDEIGKQSKEMNLEYTPLQIPSMKTTLWIDQNPIAHWLFLLFKKIYKKPIY